MVDKRVMDKLEMILSRLSVPVTVIDKEVGTNSKDMDGFLAELEEGVPTPGYGMLFVAVKQPAVVLRCAEDAPGAKDLLIMAAALTANVSHSDGYGETFVDVYRRALMGELAGAELEALSVEHQLPSEMERCVIVFYMVQTGPARAYDLLRDITPLQDRDVLLDMDRHTVVLIKDMADVESVDELVQFSQALQETLMGETAHQMLVGIGRNHTAIDDLRISYAEAKRAIDVGRVFQPEESIYAYNRLILERFMMELPKDIGSYYHSMLFNRKTQRLFNDEMLYTIDMFFKKDLNLSDTARQLYIHRNTLVYRLDKVQRQTGLDLRSFDDAVTFKILMELKKCGGDSRK